MSNTLDLRPDNEKEFQIVEKIVIQKRSWFRESFKTFGGIFIVLVMVWGASHADEISTLVNTKQELKSFSAIGTVSDLQGSSLTLSNANGSDGQKGTIYTLDISGVDTIETKDYVPLIISDIKIGDNVVVQGSIDGTTIYPKRIISFTATSSQAVVVDISDLTATTTTTATSTVDVATSTPDIATSTDEQATTTDDTATSTATSTPSVVDTVINTIQNVINTVVDVITGGTTTIDTTPTSTPDTVIPDSTTTPDTTTAPVTDTPAPIPDASSTN